MHPEVIRDKPGHCPECGMALVIKGAPTAMPHAEKVTWKSYLPLIVIVALIFLTAVMISLRDVQMESFALSKSISYFMAGFFLVFAGFKLMDLRGFAQGYSTYDLLAKRFFNYGYVYPFIELTFGFSMILIPESRGLLIIEMLLMLFSGIGVTTKLARHEKFQCACLGTFLKVPLTKVTLIEDFGMAALALLMLLLS